MAVGMASIAIGAGVYVKNQYQALQTIQAQNEDVSYSLHAKKIMNQLQTRKCGNRICVEIDPTQDAYGDKSQYRILAE